jgi:hypothetical protein
MGLIARRPPPRPPQVTNDIPDAGFPQQTFFTWLEERGIDWLLTYSDDPWMAPAFQDLRTPSSLARIQDNASAWRWRPEGGSAAGR